MFSASVSGPVLLVWKTVVNDYKNRILGRHFCQSLAWLISDLDVKILRYIYMISHKIICYSNHVLRYWYKRMRRERLNVKPASWFCDLLTYFIPAACVFPCLVQVCLCQSFGVSDCPKAFFCYQKPTSL